MADSVIYGLLDPDSLELRYVGKTEQPKERMKQHLRSSQLKAKTHRNEWIKSLLRDNKVPTFIILEKDVTDANKSEREWIANIKLLGGRLVNSTEGGDGQSSAFKQTDEAKRKIGIASSERWKASRKSTEEVLQQLSENLQTPITSKIGVSYKEKFNRWRVYYYVGGKQIHIGYFSTEQEALDARSTLKGN